MPRHHRYGVKKYRLMGKQTSLGWRVASWITMSQGLNMIEAGTAEFILDQATQQPAGFQLIERQHCDRETEGLGMPSAPSITKDEMERYAHNRPSRTIGMTAEQRLLRASGAQDGVKRAEYDAMEVLTAKVNAHRPLYRA